MAHDWLMRYPTGVRCSRGAALALGFALLASSSLATAQTELSAREHFDRGVAASRQGDLIRALAHFEKAQTLAPNPTVLYNLGQTYTALGRPVDALRVLESYLEAGGASGNSERRREVEELVRKNEQRVGTLVLELDPVDAAVAIDGANAVPNRAGEVRAALGRRLVTATHEGYRALVMPAEVKSGEPIRLRIALEPLLSQPNAFLDLSCPTPDVAVFVDGGAVGRSPLRAPVRVASGGHRVRFERRGYATFESEVVASPNATANVRCVLAADSALLPHELGELRVETSQSNAKVTVDGAPFRRGKLPLGLHSVEAAAPGYERWSELVTVRAGAPNHVDVSLKPTAEQRLADASRTRRVVAYSMGGAGLVLAGVATALYFTNQARYNDWRDDQRAFAKELAAGDPTPAHAQTALDLQDRAASIQRTDDIALGTAVLGGALVGISLVLLLTEEHTDAPRRARAGSPLRFDF
jgi:hypothetical protein